MIARLREIARAGLFALALVACSKTGGEQKASPPESEPAVDAAAPAEAASAEAPAAPRTFMGTYAASPAAIYISSESEFAKVKQAKDDPSKHVGEGAISLTIAPDGKVTGTIDSGPASPALLDGTAIGDEVRGNVRRKDPSDDGLTGTFDAKIATGQIEGTISLADGTAGIVRGGKISLSKK